MSFNGIFPGDEISADFLNSLIDRRKDSPTLFSKVVNLRASSSFSTAANEDASNGFVYVLDNFPLSSDKQQGLDRHKAYDPRKISHAPGDLLSGYWREDIGSYEIISGGQGVEFSVEQCFACPPFCGTYINKDIKENPADYSIDVSGILSNDSLHSRFYTVTLYHLNRKVVVDLTYNDDYWIGTNPYVSTKYANTYPDYPGYDQEILVEMFPKSKIVKDYEYGRNIVSVKLLDYNTKEVLSEALYETTKPWLPLGVQIEANVGYNPTEEFGDAVCISVKPRPIIKVNPCNVDLEEDQISVPSSISFQAGVSTQDLYFNAFGPIFSATESTHDPAYPDPAYENNPITGDWYYVRFSNKEQGHCFPVIINENFSLTADLEIFDSGESSGRFSARYQSQPLDTGYILLDEIVILHDHTLHYQGDGTPSSVPPFSGFTTTLRYPIYYRIYGGLTGSVQIDCLQNGNTNIYTSVGGGLTLVVSGSTDTFSFGFARNESVLNTDLKNVASLLSTSGSRSQVIPPSENAIFSSPVISQFRPPYHLNSNNQPPSGMLGTFLNTQPTEIVTNIIGGRSTYTNKLWPNFNSCCGAIGQINFQGNVS